MNKIRFWVRDSDQHFHFVAQCNVDIVDEQDEQVAHVIWTEDDAKELQDVFSKILGRLVVSEDPRNIDGSIRGGT